MTALEYAKRFPHARSQTIAYLIVQERKTSEFYTDATLNSMLVTAVAKGSDRLLARAGRPHSGELLMRIAYCMACMSTALGAASRANGTSPDFLFSPDAAWVNWPLAVIWIALGLYAFVWRPE